ncbi:hypothetical protein MKC91_20685 [[Clostridium] innocuum]|nr:hypothetical protein [[Clostridium] innocuum]MCR0413856.1 hypothetical protein [[Clostridium] innocuum]MCR0536754.1 hypothetical protein [[Clostridium] innocuum]MCR0540811.1 hypothetical protein [[Clostridium] innocuum]
MNGMKGIYLLLRNLSYAFAIYQIAIEELKQVKENDTDTGSLRYFNL